MSAMIQPAEHVASYYAATANRQTDYPILQGTESADICIVGAGFTGVATALTLAERGYSVAVVEANRIGWGASGRNGGQVIGGITGESKIAARYGDGIADMMWEMRWRGNDIIRDRVEKHAIDCELKSGYIDVALRQRHIEAFHEECEWFERHDFPYEFRLVRQDELPDIIGTSAYIGGLINMCNGHLHPLNLCLGEALAAENLGVRFFEQSPVTKIEHGPRPRVVTATGRVEADTVVLAGNAYHALERKYLGGLTFPAGSYIIATEPLAPDIVQRINPLDLAVCDMNNVVDYYRLSTDGRLLFGGRCNYSGRDPKSIRKALMPRMLKIYPELAGVRVDYEWGGKLAVVINRIPMLGRINDNVYYSQGYSGHGVNMTHIAAEIIADAIGGTLERFDLFAKMGHFRIPVGQWFGNQMVALGMLYYRLRDIL